jgi:hypothetical protein
MQFSSCIKTDDLVHKWPRDRILLKSQFLVPYTGLYGSTCKSALLPSPLPTFREQVNVHSVYNEFVTRPQCLADLVTTGAMSKGRAYTEGHLHPPPKMHTR